MHSVRGLDLAKKTGKEAWPPQARAWETAPLGKVRTFLVAKGSETAVAIGPEKRPMDTPPHFSYGVGTLSHPTLTLCWTRSKARQRRDPEQL